MTPPSSETPRFPCRVEVAVQWGDVDRMQHVNNVVFYRWLETARTRYFEALDIEKHAPGRYVILASLRCDFRAQLHYPNVISTECSLSAIGRTSATHVYRVVRRDDRAVVADGEGTWVLFDYEAQKPTPIPDALIAAMEAYEGRPITRAASKR